MNLLMIIIALISLCIEVFKLGYEAGRNSIQK